MHFSSLNLYIAFWCAFCRLLMSPSLKWCLYSMQKISFSMQSHRINVNEVHKISLKNTLFHKWVPSIFLGEIRLRSYKLMKQKFNSTFLFLILTWYMKLLNQCSKLFQLRPWFGVLSFACYSFIFPSVNQMNFWSNGQNNFEFVCPTQTITKSAIIVQ